MGHLATFTIPASKVPSSKTNFPVYIDLSLLPASAKAVIATGGGDIRVFVNSVECPRESVSFDGSTGELYTLLSNLSAIADNDIEVHGDGISLDYAANHMYGSENVWPDYSAVYHGNTLNDSTVNGLTLSPNGTSAANSSTAKLGKAFWSDGGLDNSAGSHNADDMAFMAWVRSDEDDAAGWRGAIGVDGGNTNIYAFIGIKTEHAAGQTAISYLRNSSRTRTAIATGGAPAEHDTWYMLHGQFDTETYSSAVSSEVWVNGGDYVEDRQTTSRPNGVGGGIIRVGNAIGFTALTGYVDEARARTLNDIDSDWVSIEYENQSSPATFFTITEVASAPALILGAFAA